MSNMSEFSISCWIKPTSSNLNSYLFLVRGSNQHQIRLSGDGFCFRDNHHSSQTVVSFGEPFLENTWTHISCVYKKGIIYLYQNGIQTKTANYYHEDSQTNSTNTEIRIGRQQSSTDNKYFTGYINDFRIYNHALSPMEVKQISQGLILHYLLNAKNLFNYHATTYAKSFDSNGNTKNTSGWAISDYIPIFPNQSYLGIGLSTGGSNTYAVLYDINKNKTRTILEVANQNLIVDSNQNEYYIRLSIRDLSHELTTIAKFLENNDIQYDTSGYCNNGIKIGTFQYESDTPKYNTSTYAQGGASTYLEGIILSSEAKTVSLWIKGAKTVNSAIFNDKTTGLQIGLLNSLLYVNCLASTKGFTTTHWKDNEWNHVVVINDNGIRFCYVNGQAENQSGSTNYYIHNTDKFWLWKRSYNNNYSFEGNLSDLRIYCTALSAEDVLSLYNNSAYIDNQGNIYGAIYEEV